MYYTTPELSTPRLILKRGSLFQKTKQLKKCCKHPSFQKKIGYKQTEGCLKLHLRQPLFIQIRKGRTARLRIAAPLYEKPFGSRATDIFAVADQRDTPFG